MKKLSPLLALLLVGCSTFTSEQTKADGEKTTVHIMSFWDSKSELTKLKTTQTDKSQGIGIGSLAVETSATNAVSAIEAVARGVAAGLSPAK